MAEWRSSRDSAVVAGLQHEGKQVELLRCAATVKVRMPPLDVSKIAASMAGGNSIHGFRGD